MLQLKKMVQVPKSVINRNIPPTHYTQNPYTHLLHHHLPAPLPQPQPQIRHHPTSAAARATPRRRQLLRKPPLQPQYKAPSPTTIHHPKNTLQPLQHNIPRDPQIIHLLQRHLHLHVEPENAIPLHLQFAAGVYNRRHATAAVLDVDGEHQVLHRQLGFAGLLDPALLGGAAEAVKLAVGNKGGGGAEVDEGRKCGGANGLPEVVAGHGN